MKKCIFTLCLFLLPLWGGRVGLLYSIEKVESPSLNLTAYFDVQEGRPVYWLLHKGDTVIRPSYLGIALRGEHSRGEFNDYNDESPDGGGEWSAIRLCDDRQRTIYP